MLKVLSREANLTEVAYGTLRADLLACRLRPGAKLNIAELSMRLGVSPGAVREALSRLTSEDLVTSETNRGFRVAPVSDRELQDLTSTRLDLEIACLRRAVATGGVDWETRIVAAHHRLSRTPERVTTDVERISDEWAAAHKDFHSALVGSCESRWRLRLRAFLYDQTERYRRLSVPASLEQRDLPSEHRALMDAALARDEHALTDLITLHLTRTAARAKLLSRA